MIAPELTESIVLDLVNSTDKFPVDFNLAWKWLEFTSKRNAKRSLIECEFVEGEDFRVLLPNEQNSTMDSKTSIRGRKEGRKSESIWLTLECFKSWGMMAATKKGKEVRKYFLDCERKLKQIQQNALQLKPIDIFNLDDRTMDLLEGWMYYRTLPSFEDAWDQYNHPDNSLEGWVTPDEAATLEDRLKSMSQMAYDYIVGLWTIRYLPMGDDGAQIVREHLCKSENLAAAKEFQAQLKAQLASANQQQIAQS